MSSEFNSLTVPELRGVAAQFGVDVPKTVNKKAEIIKAIEDEGVTYEYYHSLLDEQPDDAVESERVPNETVREETTVEDDDEPTVVKMTRKNKTYEIRGYRFTQQHPYALVKGDDAEFLIETGGFRPASSKEIRQFYAKD